MIVLNEDGGLLPGGSFTPEHVHLVPAWKPLRAFLTCWSWTEPRRAALSLGVILDV